LTPTNEKNDPVTHRELQINTHTHTHTNTHTYTHLSHLSHTQISLDPLYF
jgi:hypothetical protein